MAVSSFIADPPPEQPVTGGLGLPYLRWLYPTLVVLGREISTGRPARLPKPRKGIGEVMTSHYNS